MADRVDWFFRQQITQAEMDQADADLEQAERDIVADILGFGFIIDVINPATVEENAVPDSNVRANQFLGRDQLGRRLSNLRSGFQGGFNLGAPPPQVVDLLVDEVGASTTVAGGGNEKTISIFIKFTRNLQDPRTDGNGATVNFNQDESIQFNVVQSAEAPLGTSVPPPLRADQILLADVVRIFAQTTFLNADIDQSRREGFALSLLHGTTHTEAGADPVPNATGAVGGLFSGVDKTKLDGITFTDAAIAALFDTQYKVYQPANATAPAAATLDVTGLFVGKTAGGSPSTEGVVTTAPDNRVWIQDVDLDDFLDANQNKVYARLTEAAGVWTLSFFSTDETTGETVFDMTPFSGVTFLLYVQEAFLLHNLPSQNTAFSIPSDQVAAEVPLGSETVEGKVRFNVSGGVVALRAVQGSDSRLGAVAAIENSGIPLGAGNFTTLNFLGGGVVDAGAGQADVPAPPVGINSRFTSSYAIGIGPSTAIIAHGLGGAIIDYIIDGVVLTEAGAAHDPRTVPYHMPGYNSLAALTAATPSFSAIGVANITVDNRASATSFTGNVHMIRF